MHSHNTSDISFLHFSFLRDIKVHGVYFKNLADYLNYNPVVKKNHIHDFYSVILFTGGKSFFKVNNNDYPVDAKTISLIAPHQVHSLDGLETMEGIIFFFCQDFYVEEFSFLRLLNVFSCTSELTGGECNPCINLSDEEYCRIDDILKSIEREYRCFTPSNNSSRIIRSLLNIMLLRISEVYEAKPEKLNSSDNIVIHKLSNLVDSYFIKEQHIGFYTTALNISEKSLNDICNRNFNCGLKKILADRLMQEARKLLLYCELSVSEIAFKLNYEDNSYFNKVFKKQTGITPKRFRDLHRKFVP